jgi:hypothetical protein
VLGSYPIVLKINRKKIRFNNRDNTIFNLVLNKEVNIKNKIKISIYLAKRYPIEKLHNKLMISNMAEMLKKFLKILSLPNKNNLSNHLDIFK